MMKKRKKRTKTSLIFMIFYKTVEVFTALTLVLFLLGIWRLYKGPLEVKSLTPILVDVLTPEDSDLTVEIDSVYIELALKRGHLLDIKATHLSLLRPDDTILANIPSANISLNPFKLIMGEIVPSSIYLNKPYLNLTTASTEKSKNKSPSSRSILDGISYILDHMRHIEKFEIDKGEFVLDTTDQKAAILIPELNASLTQISDANLDVQLSSTLYIDGVFTPFWLQGTYQTETHLLAFESNFKELQIPKFAPFLPILEGLDITLSGQLSGSLNFKAKGNKWRNIANQLSFAASLDKEGSVYLPEPLDTTYDVKMMALKGYFTPHLDELIIRNSQIELYGPVANLEATVKGIGAFLDTQDMAHLQSNLTSTIRNVPVKQVPDVWPSLLGSDAHEWVKQNITTGLVNRADFILDFIGNEIKEVKGLVKVENADVRYLEGMPLVNDVVANVVLQLGRVDIEVLNGQTDNIKIDTATLHLTELLSDTPLAEIDIEAAGPLSESLHLIGLPPLELTEKFELDPKTVSGTARAKVHLTFPLDENITTDDVRVSVNASLDQAAFVIPDTEAPLKEGTFLLDVDNTQLSLKGTALYKNVPVQLTWIENFIEKAPFVSQYHILGEMAPSLLLPFYDKVDLWFKGSLGIDALITEKKNGQTNVALKASIDKAEINLPIGYIKELGTKGEIKADLLFKKKKLTELSSFLLTIPADKVTISGKGTFGQNIHVQVDKMIAPRNNASFTYTQQKNGAIQIAVKGKSLNITDIIHGPSLTKTRTPEEVEKLKNKPQNFSLQATLDNLYLSDEKPLTNIQMDIRKQNNKWEKFYATATATEPIVFNLNDKKDQMIVTTQDVGSFLSWAGYTHRIKGGKLRTVIKQTDQGVLQGEIVIRQFDLTQTSFLTQAMTILGILDAFRGNFIPFKRASIPFELSVDNVVRIRDAVASGGSLGITLRGKMSSDLLDLEGSIVPAYAINSLPGKIPLIGRLFSGEKGGGLFGVSFSATGTPNDPKVNINPATLLAPGIIRRIFQ